MDDRKASGSPDQAIAQGALLGALIGDAAGATLEFLGRAPTVAECERALCMVGGGVWGVAPGQITDDGELTLCLARSLSGQSRYDPDRAAQAYLEWYASGPFDVGMATRNAFSVQIRPGQRASAGVTRAAKFNENSKANGALMRAAPLGVWGFRLSPKALAQAAIRDTNLSHPNPTCRYATVAYVLAMRHLVLNPRDATGALASARVALTHSDAQEVLHWLDEAQADKDPGYYPQAGFVRYGFTHAFRHLAKGSGYREALVETLHGGGDTDTNACIVGGLIGALHGVEGIPLAMRQALLNCDTELGNPRPEWLSTRNADALAIELLS